MSPFASNYPTKSLRSLRTDYDYVVVGGGTAGCVLARRLSEDGKSTVLLVERGDARDSWLDTVPIVSMYHFADGKHTNVVKSARDNQLGRSLSLATGLGLGGTTRINGMQYTCGVPAQFNSWAQQGRQGWAYSDLKPYFDKSEQWTGPVPNEYHGLNGPLQVRAWEGYSYESSAKAAVVAKKMGFRDILDMHSPLEPSTGINKMQYTIDSSGRRQSAFRAYLPQDFAQKQDNLHICIKVQACKLAFSKNSDGSLHVDSVELQGVKGGPTRVITARQEVVLTCGALRTPQLLMLSGVGPQDHLQEMGINLAKHSPGVGQHLQDHLIMATNYNCPLSDSLWSMIRRPTTLLKQVYKYIRHGSGWLLFTLVEMEIFGKSAFIDQDGMPSAMTEAQLDSFDPKNLPDFAILLAPLADPASPGADKSKGLLSISPALMLPKSTGSLRLRSLDPKADPECDMQYLTCPEDYAALRAALRVSAALAREMRATGYELTALLAPDVSDDAALDEFIRERADTMFHYTSTCRMAPETDENPGVVDNELRVHGIPNLRIADASIFPTVPAAHLQALVYAVAEKCADLIQRSSQGVGL